MAIRKRRLAAIMITDIVGFSSISRRSEELAMRVLEDHDSLLRNAFAEYEGNVVVLPFADMSREAGQECFCDGMTEELIDALSRSESLKVVARTSSFAFKKCSIDVREIGRRLDVEAVLEGSVRTAGGRARIAEDELDTVNTEEMVRVLADTGPPGSLYPPAAVSLQDGLSALHLDPLRLLLGRRDLLDPQLQNAILVRCLDILGVDMLRQGE